MSSMIPRYSTAPFVSFDSADGEYIVMEAEFFLGSEHEEGADPESVVFYNDDRFGGPTVWFCELHMPGYLDRTGWDGPFPSEEEARQHIIDTYDCDPDTGKLLDYDED